MPVTFDRSPKNHIPKIRESQVSALQEDCALSHDKHILRREQRVDVAQNSVANHDSRNISPLVERTAHRIHQIIVNRPSADVREIKTMLSELNREERSQLRNTLRSTYGIGSASTPREQKSPQTESQLSPQKERVISSSRELYQAMKGGITGLGTDEKKIFLTLHDKTAPEIKEITRCYKEQYGRDLVHDLRSELKDNQRFLSTLETMLKGEPASSAAALLRLETKMPAPDANLLVHMLGDKSPQDLRLIKQAFLNQHEETIEHEIQKVFSPNESAKLLAALKGNHLEVEVLTLRELLEKETPRNSAQVLTILCANDAQEMKDLMHLYEARYGHSLTQDLSRSLKDLDLAEAQALLKGDPLLANVIQLRSALENRTSITETLYEVFRGKPVEQVAEINKLYRMRCGSELLHDLYVQREIPQALKQIEHLLLERGQLDSASELFLAVQARSERKDQILRILDQLPADHATEAMQQLQQRFGISMDQVLSQGFTKAERFEVRCAMLGRAENTEDRLWNARILHRFDREQRTMPDKTLDIFSPHGKNWDKRIRKLEDIARRRAASLKPAANDLPLEELIAYAQSDRAIYRNAKYALTHLLAHLFGSLIFILFGIILHQADFSLWQTLGIASAVGLFSDFLLQRSLLYYGKDRLDLVSELQRYRQESRKKFTRSTKTRRQKNKEILIYRRLTRADRAKILRKRCWTTLR